MSLVQTLRFIAAHPLNKGSELQSLLRFARWQVGSRLLGDAVVHDWVGGSRFLVRRGEAGLTGNIYTGLHEFADMGYLLHVLRADDLFVDVGANVGSYSILACAAARAHGVAFEPAPVAYRRLVENLRLNQVEDRVCCFNAGAGDVAGVVRFSSGTDTTNHVATSDESSADVIEVKVVKLDDALKDASPAVIKIDVEGYETPALRGARETLSKASLHSVIMELNGSGRRYGFDESLILKSMRELGFKTYTYDPLRRQLSDLEGVNLQSGNTLFIRDRALVAARIAAAPTFSIFGKTF